ncbi:MAG: GNAT family N-acetyltransferase [Sphingobium sp.]
MTLIPVNARDVATVVTYLELRRRPKPSPVQATPLRMEKWSQPELEKYRVLFKRIGEPWLWFSRLAMGNHELTSIIHDPLVDIYAVLDPKGIEVGILELDFRDEGRCEIAFLGLVPQLAGQGFGRWLMAQAMTYGWRKGVTHMTVNTCSLDDPRALATYAQNGFAAVGRTIQTFPDPRLTGLLAPDAAPHVPILKTPR